MYSRATKYEKVRNYETDFVYSYGFVFRSQQGQALLTAVIFLLFASVGLLAAFSSISLRETRSSHLDVRAKQAFFLTEAGVEDVAWRIRNGRQYASVQAISLGGATATVAVTEAGNQRVVESTGDVVNAIRKTRVVLRSGVGVAFVYGVQVDEGGLQMGNNSAVIGNVFSNGDIQGNGRTASTITGTAEVAGTHAIAKIRVDQNASAHHFAECSIGGTAEVVAAFVDCTAAATSTLAQPLAPQTFPISPAVLDAWKAEAAAGGTLAGFGLGNNATASLGPKKINGNMTFGNNAILTLTGTVWVTGTITFGNGDTVRLAPGYGTNSGLLIVDGPVVIGNTITLAGSGAAGSYLMFVSLFAGPGDAIDVGNSATSAIFYAPNGFINIGNNLSLREATAYGLRINNNASITYESGLQNVNFSAGPTGGWVIQSWREVK